MTTTRHAQERQNVAAVIRSERLRRGWSVSEAAERVGVAPSAWSRWETSTSLPRPKMMREIGALLDLRDDWMVPIGVSPESVAVDLDDRLARIEAQQREMLEQVRTKDRLIEALYDQLLRGTDGIDATRSIGQRQERSGAAARQASRS